MDNQRRSFIGGLFAAIAGLLGWKSAVEAAYTVNPDFVLYRRSHNPERIELSFDGKTWRGVPEFLLTPLVDFLRKENETLRNHIALDFHPSVVKDDVAGVCQNCFGIVYKSAEGLADDAAPRLDETKSVVHRLTLDDAREIAAQCWCYLENAGTTMDANLCERFAKRLVSFTEPIQATWDERLKLRK